MSTTNTELSLLNEQASALISNPIIADEEAMFSMFKQSESILAKQMEEGRPITEDPELAIETYKMLAKANVDFLEAKRRAVDTALKAYSFIAQRQPQANQPLPNTVLPTQVDSESTANSSFAALT